MVIVGVSVSHSVSVRVCVYVSDWTGTNQIRLEAGKGHFQQIFRGELWRWESDTVSPRANSLLHNQHFESFILEFVPFEQRGETKVRQDTAQSEPENCTQSARSPLLGWLYLNLVQNSFSVQF